MVKNLSNPLNARKVAKILADDTVRSGFAVDERDISVFFSDHRINDLSTAIKQLQQEKIIPGDYNISDQCRDELLAGEFIDEHTLFGDSSNTDRDIAEIMGDINTNSIEFKTQLESLKNKLIKSWSGGISIEGHELDNFDRKFARPMEYFKLQMNDPISDLQAFAVVYATDQLSLGDNSKEDVYYLMFGRFDEHKDTLDKEFGFHYNWPQISGTSFIDMGKKFSIHAELSEFGKKLRSISGLDTYPDEVIQVMFFNLISGKLIDEMIEKKMIFRWTEDHETVADPLKWLLPPSDFNVDKQTQHLLTQAVIGHTLLMRIESNPPSLIELLREIKPIDNGLRTRHLAKKIEAGLTRKSVALQFGTTLANSFENFKTNPAKITPFLETTLRYYSKAENIDVLLSTVEHSVRTALKNSTGLIKEYLRNISDDDLEQTISFNLKNSIHHAISHGLPDFEAMIIQGENINHDQLDQVLQSLSEEGVKNFFQEVFDQLYNHTNQYAKSLENTREEPTSTEGGLNELTHDFESMVKYHGRKNPQTKILIQHMINYGLDHEVAELIANICSYITYQVASKEGSNGEQMLNSLVNNYQQKALDLAMIKLTDKSSLKNRDEYSKFILDDLRQAHVIVALASKLKTDAYNAWTPLQGGRAKSTQFLNELVIPNLFYWQRLPKDFIMQLVQQQILEKSSIKTVVTAAHRLTMIEAFQLLAMGSRQNINTMEEAKSYIAGVFGIDEKIDNKFMISPRSGEAEIAMETIYLWSELQEVN